MGFKLLKLYTKHCRTVVVFLLTVILTNIRQLSGPMFLLKESPSFGWRCRGKCYSSRPDVMQPINRCCFHRYTHKLLLFFIPPVVKIPGVKNKD